MYCDWNVFDNFFDIFGCLGLLEMFDLSFNKLEKMFFFFGLLSNLCNFWFMRNCLRFFLSYVFSKGIDSILEFFSDFLDDLVVNS